MHPEGADANQNSHRTPRPGACRSGHDVSEWGKAEITPKPHSEKKQPAVRARSAAEVHAGLDERGPHRGVMPSGMAIFLLKNRNIRAVACVLQSGKYRSALQPMYQGAEGSSFSTRGWCPPNPLQVLSRSPVRFEEMRMPGPAHA